MSVKIYSIDRFEGGKAVLLFSEDPTVEVLLPNDLVPMNIREGDIVKVTKEDGVIKSIEFIEKESLEAQNLYDDFKKKHKKKR